MREMEKFFILYRIQTNMAKNKPAGTQL